jgi:hypothetical protein
MHNFPKFDYINENSAAFESKSEWYQKFFGKFQENWQNFRNFKSFDFFFEYPKKNS